MKSKGITKLNRALEMIAEACDYTSSNSEADRLTKIHNKLEWFLSK